MKSHFFAYLSRLRFISRWALMRNTATENVQEHSHQAAVLAHALAVIRNQRFGGHVDAGAVAVAALYHDASEILTGDMRANLGGPMTLAEDETVICPPLLVVTVMPLSSTASTATAC